MILQNWWYTTLMGILEPMQPPLRGEVKAEVAIVGGGASGLAAALALAKQGVNTVLLDRNICGGSSTGKSAGFLTPDSELELAQLLRRFGTKGARDLWEAALKGIEIMLGAVREFDIRCDLRKQDSLFVGRGSAGWKYVEEEAKVRKDFGYPGTLYDRRELPKALGSEGFAGGIRYPGTYGVNPLLYAQGLKHGLLQLGVKVFEASEVEELDGHTVRTHLGSVTADHIIFCADKPKPRVTRYSWNVYHAQTFLGITEPVEDSDISRMFPDGPLQCWDSDLIYSYWRLTGDGRLLLGGGSLMTTFSRRDVTTPAVIEKVIRRFREKFPYVSKLDFIQYWPGRIDMTRDLLPTVVRDPKRPWVHHVLGCVGLPWATFCGDFAARAALDKADKDERRYYRYFSSRRPFLLPIWLEKIVGKRIVFSLNNAWAKYWQNDQGKEIPFDEDLI